LKGTNIEERESTHNTFEIPTLNTILNKGGYLEKYVRRKEEKKNYKKNNSKNGNLLLNKRVFWLGVHNIVSIGLLPTFFIWILED